MVLLCVSAAWLCHKDAQKQRRAINKADRKSWTSKIHSLAVLGYVTPGTMAE